MLLSENICLNLATPAVLFALVDLHNCLELKDTNRTQFSSGEFFGLIDQPYPAASLRMLAS